MTKLTDLPNELLDVINSKLDIRSRVNLSQTNHRFNQWQVTRPSTPEQIEKVFNEASTEIHKLLLEDRRLDEQYSLLLADYNRDREDPYVKTFDRNERQAPLLEIRQRKEEIKRQRFQWERLMARLKCGFLSPTATQNED